MLTPAGLAVLLLATMWAGCAETYPAPALDAETPTGSLHVLIVHAAIVPLPDVLVNVRNFDDNATTDADGQFVIEDLELGAYQREFSRPCYQTVVMRSTSSTGPSPRSRRNCAPCRKVPGIWKSTCSSGTQSMRPERAAQAAWRRSNLARPPS